MNDKILLQLVEKYLDKQRLLKNNTALCEKDIDTFFDKMRDALPGEEENVSSWIPPAESKTPGDYDFDELRLYTDGASRGNPGPAAVGCVLLDKNGRDVDQISQYIGKTTNNVAEYTALICGVERALSYSANRVKIYMDSQLVARQVLGEYKVRDPHLHELWGDLMSRLKRFIEFEIRHIPRAENKRADKLANEALDKIADNH